MKNASHIIPARPDVELRSERKYFYTEYSDKELYDGLITLTQMLSKLGTFSIVTRWAGDVLLRN